MQWLLGHWVEVLRLTLEHVVLCGISLAIAVLLAVPLGVWVHNRPRRMGAVGGVAGVLYTIPSLALFAMLVPVVGLGMVPAMIGLVLYSQLILVRAVASGLDSVPHDVRDAAVGMGIDRLEILRKVDLPLALPVFLAGLRIATVTLIGIATVGAVIDAGGLGELVLQGIQRDFPAKVLTGAIAVTVLALAADAMLLRVERRARPWLQARAA